MVWLLGLIAAELVGQSSVVIYGLVNVRLYVQSLRVQRRNPAMGSGHVANFSRPWFPHL